MRKNADTIAIYSRKSKFTGKGESIGNQIDLCREYVQVHYGETAAQDLAVYEDEGFSGGNLNRPAFKKMMEAARAHQHRAIIVYRLDRISRSISDFSGLIEELARLDIAFVSIKEQFDTGTPMGRAMMYIASVFSQLERETIAERIRDNMHELAKTGRWLGGTTPTGFASEAVKSVTIDGKIKKACKLRLIPAQADLVRLIYELYRECDSLTLTEAELMKRGIKTKNGNYFTRFSIRAILQNPVYMTADQAAYEYFASRHAELFSVAAEFDGVHGMMAYNRTDQEKGRAVVWRPVSEWIVAVGRHPGIIPGSVWVSVQESLERNKSKAYRKPRGNEALLTGLLYCSCGGRMYPKCSKQASADGKRAFRYVCKIKERSRGQLCGQKNADGTALDGVVMEQLRYVEEDAAVFLRTLEQERRRFADGPTEPKVRLEMLCRERRETEKTVDMLVDSLAALQDGAARERVEKRIEALDRKIRELDSCIRELKEAAAHHALGENDAELLCRSLAVFSSAVDHMTIEQKRAAVRCLIHKVVWDGETAHIVFAGGSAGAAGSPELPDTGEPKAARNSTEQPETGRPGAVQTRWREDSK